MVAVATAAWVASIGIGGSGFGSLPALPVQIGHGLPPASHTGLQTASVVHTLRDRRGRIAWIRQRRSATASADRIRRSDRDT